MSELVLSLCKELEELFLCLDLSLWDDGEDEDGSCFGCDDDNNKEEELSFFTDDSFSFLNGGSGGRGGVVSSSSSEVMGDNDEREGAGDVDLRCGLDFFLFLILSCGKYRQLQCKYTRVEQSQMGCGVQFTGRVRWKCMMHYTIQSNITSASFTTATITI